MCNIEWLYFRLSSKRWDSLNILLRHDTFVNQSIICQLCLTYLIRLVLTEYDSSVLKDLIECIKDKNTKKSVFLKIKSKHKSYWSKDDSDGWEETIRWHSSSWVIHDSEQNGKQLRIDTFGFFESLR